MCEQNLEILCRKAVDLKEDIDACLNGEKSLSDLKRTYFYPELSSVIEESYNKCKGGAERKSINHRIFSYRILPFLVFEKDFSKLGQYQDDFDYESAVLEDVDPNLTISGRYRAYIEDEEKNREDADRSDRDSEKYEEDKKYNSNLLRVWRVCGFPLYVPYEGKNRVSLFRKLDRVMKAQVVEHDYVSPEEFEVIKEYSLFNLGRCYFWIKHKSIEGRKIILFPEITVPLLQRYAERKNCSIKIKNTFCVLGRSGLVKTSMRLLINKLLIE